MEVCVYIYIYIYIFIHKEMCIHIYIYIYIHKCAFRVQDLGSIPKVPMSETQVENSRK